MRCGFAQAVMPAEQVDLDDVQRVLLYGMSRLQVSTFLLLHFPSPKAAKAWLTAVRCRVASAKRERHNESDVLQIAFSFAGLRMLEHPIDYDTFLPEFRQGMTAPPRVRALRDPQNVDWAWPAPGGDATVHAICGVYATDRTGLAAALAREKVVALKHSVGIVREVPTQSVVKEPFGFRDGISQPFVLGSGRSLEGVEPRDRIMPGEFVLGYRNEFGVYPASPRILRDHPARGLDPAPLSDVGDLGRNGSYLVVRELRQDLEGFGRLSPEAQARVIGRHQDGRPLVACPVDRPLDGAGSSPPTADSSPPTMDAELTELNHFTFYPSDAAGLRCPLGAHIRRANPRDALAADGAGRAPSEAIRLANQHRILRRSRALDRDPEAGLLFMCFNTNIERQFEFVQQTWIGNHKFTGPNDEVDPLLSSGGTFTVRAGPEREVISLESYVKLLGGEYFFMPGLRALAYLGSL